MRHATLKVGADRIYGFAASGEAGMRDGSSCHRCRRSNGRNDISFGPLGFAGFGFSDPASPCRRTEQARPIRSCSIWISATTIRAAVQTGTFVPGPRSPRLGSRRPRRRYELFVDEFGRRRPTSTDGRFALVELVQWRRFPFVVRRSRIRCSRRVAGSHRQRLFDTKHEAWSATANEWFVHAEVAGG
jgi:hypothetical protein